MEKFHSIASNYVEKDDNIKSYSEFSIVFRVLLTFYILYVKITYLN
jgi:hypothetical protein